MKHFFPILFFFLFLLGGGLLYTNGLFGGRILGIDSYFANTTLWWWIVLLVWCFGLYLLRVSLDYKNNWKGMGLVGCSALMFYGGFMFIENFIP